MSIVALGACKQDSNTSKEIEQSVKIAMQEQQQNWNSGNIDGFMKWYWKSDSLKFVSKKGVSYGWEKVMNNYKDSYPTKEKMGQLQFEITKVESISTTHAFVIGSWNLSYTEQPDVGGYFTLLWNLKPEGWRIVVDHTS